MKRFQTLLQNPQTKLWLLTLAVAAVLVLNLGAIGDTTPQQWEYKTLWFRVNLGDDMNTLQQRFAAALNAEGAYGWEYVGRCAHNQTLNSCIDFLVFRRPK